MIRLLAKQLKVPSFANYDNVLRRQDPAMGYEDFLLELMTEERESRVLTQQKRRLRAAAFPYLKTLDEFRFGSLAHVKEAYIRELASCDYIEMRQNIIMIGNPGTGKTHLSIALGQQACKAGFKVRFFTAAGLANELAEAQENRSLSRLEKSLLKCELLILDEMSYLTFSRHHSELLFQVISGRSERGSVILSTNLEFSRWPDMFSSDMLVNALVDRLTFRSHILNMNGDSYRMNERCM